MKIFVKASRRWLVDKFSVAGIAAAAVIAFLLLGSPGWARNPAAGTPNYLPGMYQH